MYKGTSLVAQSFPAGVVADPSAGRNGITGAVLQGTHPPDPATMMR